MGGFDEGYALGHYIFRNLVVGDGNAASLTLPSGETRLEAKSEFIGVIELKFE